MSFLRQRIFYSIRIIIIFLSAKSFQKLSIKLKPTLHVSGVVILVLLLLIWSLLHGLCFMDALDNRPASFSYFLLKAVISGVIIFFLLSFLMLKKEDALSSLFSGVLVLYLSLGTAIFLGMLFGAGEYWYLKYSIGIFIGIIVYFKKCSYLGTCLITFLSVLSCEHVEYLKLFDPPLTHNFIYQKSSIEIQSMLLLFLVISPIFTPKLLGYLAKLSFFR